MTDCFGRIIVIINLYYNCLNQPKLSNTRKVNTYSTLSNAAPFGGFKESGIGREGGEYSLENYTEVNLICVAKFVLIVATYFAG